VTGAWTITLTYDADPDMDTMDSWEDQLDDLKAFVSRIPDNGIQIIAHVPDHLSILDAINKVTDRVSSVVTGSGTLVGLEIVGQLEQDRRAKTATTPELMSAAEIADLLDVTRQRVHQLRETAAFPAPLAELRGGAIWDARAVRKFELEWSRKPGRPARPMSRRDSQSGHKLFDEFERIDSTRKPYSGESVFQFMNRVDRVDWARVREELEAWYSEYRDSDNDLRNRFQSQREDQHYGAWWELYVYTFYRRLRYAVDVHPTMPNGTKPDFVVTREGVSTYVECKAIPAKPRSAHEAWILDATNKVRHGDFLLELDIEREGKEQPRAASIRTNLEKWLNTLDADDVLSNVRAGKDDFPSFTLPVKDWRLTYTAYPVDREKRGERAGLLAVPPSSGAAFIDDVGPIRKALREKGRKYADLAQPLEDPLVVAINSGSGFLENSDVDQALFGSAAFTYLQGAPQPSIHSFRRENGYWRRNPPAGTRVSAVLIGRNIDPWGAVRDVPQIWVNPWAPVPISDTYSLTTTTADDSGKVTRVEGSLAVNELFGLPEDWPQVDKP
jgi:hypothetical protein